jgi:hypothetical protein
VLCVEPAGPVLHHRQDRAARRRAQITELNQRAAETEQRLKRLYDAIESGIADLDDPALKDRIAGLKAIRDQARTEAERAQATLDGSGHQTITPDMVREFASIAASACASPAAATASTTSAPSPSGSKSRIKKSVSWDQKVIY